MASCSICARETCDAPMPRDPNVKYSQGDFYSLRESVYTPIYDILRSTFSALGSESDAWKRNQHSFEALTSVPNVIKDGRPAVVMQDEDDNPQGLRNS
uniref:Bromo domain-containing protein n=1 Tax=Ganoderma boninense TaxID=34458 RepID=A0A5K1K7Y8_9APHY|nr:Bromo domain-containing protein [Ganoderma boninense]